MTYTAGYRLTALVGEGGMAVVFRGENVLDPRLVRAIKVVRPHLAARPEFVTRFAAEARALDQLTHPNVVRFYGFRPERGLLLMELELLEGRVLSEALPRGGRLDPQKATLALWQAAEGVAAAHALGFVHRDLKPENIFITRAEEVKVLDFGLARAIDAADRESRATVAGHVPGTPAYMAPEACEGADPDARCDVYALGLTLYELLLGHHPYRPPGQAVPSSLQLMRMQVDRTLEPIGEVVPGLPPGLEAVVGRATSKDPALRYPSARELADGLRSVLQAWSTGAGGGRTEVALPTFRLGTPSRPGVPTNASSGSLSHTKPSRTTGFRLAPWLIALGVVVVATGVLGLGLFALWYFEVGKKPEPAEAEAAPVDPREAANPWVRVAPPADVRQRPPAPARLAGKPALQVGEGLSGEQEHPAPTGPVRDAGARGHLGRDVALDRGGSRPCIPGAGLAGLGHRGP